MLLTTVAVTALAVETPAGTLNPVPSRDRKVVRRWELPGDPRGLAIGADGTIYVGLAEPQAVVAIDPETGAVKKRIVLDSAEIASTKELVTLRTNPQRTRLYVANGSDESATILSLPDLGVLREITKEGETIRDVVPDPKGRYVYLLGRRVHVYDADGRSELRTLDVTDPMALAVSADALAVFATEDFGNTKATVVTMYDAKNFARITKDPLQTTKTIEGALFSAKDRTLIALSRDSIFHRNAIPAKGPRGNIINSRLACFPENSGPQIATLTTDDTLVYAERRCSASGAFTSSTSGITPASLYGVDAYAITYDAKSNTIIATDRTGFLTIYHVPRVVISE
ncbi:MAG TPA: hypothetical protein VHW00_09915 [Thermoanaerobaculia bacterium]|nr:hypothetical protein [Thermoanaerobaculia bacterium]